MSEEVKYEYKAKFMNNRGSWVDCTVLFYKPIDAREYRRRFKGIHKDVPIRIMRRPAEWEVCE